MGQMRKNFQERLAMNNDQPRCCERNGQMAHKAAMNFPFHSSCLRPLSFATLPIIPIGPNLAGVLKIEHHGPVSERFLYLLYWPISHMRLLRRNFLSNSSIIYLPGPYSSLSQPEAKIEQPRAIIYLSFLPLHRDNLFHLKYSSTL